MGVEVLGFGEAVWKDGLGGGHQGVDGRAQIGEGGIGSGAVKGLGGGGEGGAGFGQLVERGLEIGLVIGQGGGQLAAQGGGRRWVAASGPTIAFSARRRRRARCRAASYVGMARAARRVASAGDRAR